mgnify:CR=1 FL=1
MHVKHLFKRAGVRWGCFVFLSLIFIAGTSVLSEPATAEDNQAASGPAAENLPRTVGEARGRARWLHELVHGALQVMHRDFFGDDQNDHTLPSQSLEDVFAEMARSYAVEIRWFGVNANRGKDHLPKDRFEQQAAAALLAGETEYESIEGGRYRFAGRIRLQNECLKCHVPNRQSLEDRMAGLAISFPIAVE